MKYENINANDTKLKPPDYKKFDYTKFDYHVGSHVDFGKLFLQNHMAKFNAFNETCDASAVLSLLGRIPVFSSALQNAANVVREARNAWGHCKFTEWDEPNFKKRFSDMKNLVKEVGLLPADESKVLTDLNDWETKGTELFMPCYISFLCHVSAFFNYISGGGGAIAPPRERICPPPPVKPFLPPKCEAELLMIAVRIAVD